MLLCGPTLYKECCERYSVKPNRHILEQLNRTDLMYLTKVDASKTFLGSLGVRALLDFVEAHRGIEELDLQKNGVDQPCIERLCQILSEGHPRLHSITLSNNLLSEGGARLLWDTVRSAPTVLSLKLDNCNVSEQWIQRLTYVLGVNASRVEDTTHVITTPAMSINSAGIPVTGNSGLTEDDQPWRTISILVISSSESYIKLFHDAVVLPLGSYFSLRRIRITASVVTPSDSCALVETKIEMCKDPNNGGLPWCATFFDSSHPFSASQRHAVQKVLEILPRTEATLTDSKINDKNNTRDGNLEGKCKRIFFFYAVLSSALIKRFGERRFFDYHRLLRFMEFEGGEDERLAALFPGTGAPVLKNATHLTVRCQSDLYAGISIAYSHSKQLLSRQASFQQVVPVEDPAKVAAISNGQEKVIKTLLSYLANNISMDLGNDAFSVPMLLYGSEGIGKEHVLSYIAAHVQKTAEETKVNEERNGSAADNGALLVPQRTDRVITYNVQAHSDSLVAFLYFILSVFNPSASLEYETIDVLCCTVREAISGYREEQPIVLLVSHVEALRWNNFNALDARTGTGSPNSCCGYLEWIPPTFPPTVRIILSLHGDHPARTTLRQRCPQPKEYLCNPLPGRDLIDLLNHYLLSKFEMKLPGLHTLTSTLRDRFTAAELAYLEKPHHAHVKFAEVAAAYLACTLYERENGVLLSDEEEVVSLLRNMPGTLEQVVQKICESLSVLYSPITVRYISVCLCMSPMPPSELLYICEELGDCPKHMTSVVLKGLTMFNLVHADSTSCLLSIAHDSIRDGLLHLYADHISSISVVVEQHLYRLVATLSTEIFWAFRSLVPLQLANGSFNSLGNLLQSSVIMDAVLSSSPLNQIAVIDAFFQLQWAQQLLDEMTDSGYPVGDDLYSIDAQDLATGLQHVQQYRSHFLQEVLFAKGNSALIQDAQKNAQFASYPVVLAVNNGTEDTSQQQLQCDAACLFCTCRDDYVAAVTSDSVMAFSMKKNGNCVAHRNISFSSVKEGGEVMGIHIAAQMKAIVVRKNAILVLDFSNGTTWSMEGYRTNISGTACLLNKSGRLLALLHAPRPGEDSTTLEVFNLTTRSTESRLERPVLPSSKASFCGDYILVTVRKHVYVFTQQLKEKGVLEHDGRVGSVCGAENRKIVVTSVGSCFWVWNFNGTFLNRVDTGRHPIFSLTIDSSGSLLITRHAKSLRLWNAASGTFIATLLTNSLGNTSAPCFTTDNRKILAITGSILNVWDSQSGISIGAIASPSGSFTSFSEENNLVYTTSVSSSMIKVWNIGPENALSLEKEVLEGTLATQLLRNRKVSKHALLSISTDPDNEIVLCLDAKGEAFLFSLESGKKIETQLSETINAAFLLGRNTIVFTVKDGIQVMYYSINTHTTISYPLSHTMAPSSQLHLHSSLENNDIFAISTDNGTNGLFICEVSKSRSSYVNLYHHRGPVLDAFFFGSFMFSVGAEDKHACLWNVPKRACRADYKHPLVIEHATCTPSGVLFFADESGEVYQLITEDITSPTHARLVATKLSYLFPKKSFSLKNLEIKSILCWSNLFFCGTKSDEVAILALEKGVINRIRTQRNVTKTRIAEVNQKQKILMGTATGECMIFDLILPHRQPFHLLEK